MTMLDQEIAYKEKCLEWIRANPEQLPCSVTVMDGKVTHRYSFPAQKERELRLVETGTPGSVEIVVPFDGGVYP